MNLWKLGIYTLMITLLTGSIAFMNDTGRTETDIRAHLIAQAELVETDSDNTYNFLEDDSNLKNIHNEEAQYKGSTTINEDKYGSAAISTQKKIAFTFATPFKYYNMLALHDAGYLSVAIGYIYFMLIISIGITIVQYIIYSLTLYQTLRFFYHKQG